MTIEELSAHLGKRVLVQSGGINEHAVKEISANGAYVKLLYTEPLQPNGLRWTGIFWVDADAIDFWTLLDVLEDSECRA